MRLNDIVNDWKVGKDVTITTSGSTGKPKRILLGQKLVRWSAQNTKRALHLDSENVLICIDVNKIGGRMMVYRSIIYNWDYTVIIPTADPLVSIDYDHPHTFVSLVPYQLDHILLNPDSVKKLLRFETVLLGGSKVSSSLKAKIQELSSDSNTQFWHSYGMTETASHIALRNLSQNQTTFVAFDDVCLSISDRNTLAIEIPAVDLSITTNDVVQLHADGFEYVGRIDDVVNSGGIKIQLHDVEEQIHRAIQPNGIEFFCWKVSDELLGEKLVFVGIQNQNQTDIEEQIKEQLESVHTPKVYLWTDEFDYLESGKINKRKTTERLIEIRR